VTRRPQPQPIDSRVLLETPEHVVLPVSLAGIGARGVAWLIDAGLRGVVFWLVVAGLFGVLPAPEGAAEGEPVARGADWAWTWYERGVAGLAAGDAEAWTLVTDCGVSTSGALSSWVGAQPAWFTEDRSPLWVR
jgi:hypothetical protein